MSNEDIIRMAREAGFVVDEKAKQHQPNCIFHTHHMVDELLERFAALVAKRAVSNIDPASWMSYQEGYAAGVAAEREACAKECEAHWEIDGSRTAQEFAAAIRARGEKK
jgi:hypothetical protein